MHSSGCICQVFAWAHVGVDIVVVARFYGRAVIVFDYIATLIFTCVLPSAIVIYLVVCDSQSANYVTHKVRSRIRFLCGVGIVFCLC